MRFNVRFKLPQGFRHLFSRKEVRSLKEQTNVSFDTISFGKITNRETYNEDQHIYSDLHPISISARQNESGWIFNIYQNAFRVELLPKQFETDVKTKVVDMMVSYIKKIDTSKETDLLRGPELRVNIQIIQNKVEIKAKEVDIFSFS